MRSNRYGAIVILLAALGGAVPASAQGLFGSSSVGPNGGFTEYSGGSGGGEGLTDAGGLPGQDERLNYFTTPLGNSGKQGPFVYADGLYYSQNWTLGKQLVAWRGLVDSTGVITGAPGTFIGSGVRALSTDQFGRSGSFSPGFKLGAGWKFDDGSTITASFSHIPGQQLSAGATLATPFGRSNADLSDTFLTSGVFNFPPQFVGPDRRTTLEGTTVGAIPGISPGRVVPDRAFNGVWDGASNMVISYKRWYDDAEIGGRVPLFESNTSKVYGMGGLRAYTFVDRFRWLSQVFDLSGNTGGRFEGRYENTLSQRMYGPYIGCSHDVYLKNNFSLSADLTGGLLFNFVHERAAYKLGDLSVASHRQWREVDLTPTAGGNVNLWWYPVRGIQLRVGYSAMTFYNTRNMQDPIGFNYGAIDPVYGTQYFRIVHGLNIGLGVFF